jgi:predicted heme/steroid binding protein
MTQPFVPTALEQLLIKQVAVNGVPFQSEGWINFTGSVTGTDNPGFTVNGVVVGATNVAITGGGGGGSPTGTGLYYTTLGVMNPAAVGFSGDVSLSALSAGNVPTTLVAIQTHPVIAPSPSIGNVLAYVFGEPTAWRSTASGGDITGPYTALNVAYLQGNLLTAPSPSAGQVLMWTAGDTPAWKPQTAGSSSGDITGEYTDLNVVGFNGVPLNLTAATNGQVYVFNSGSSSWVATTLSGSFAAGGDLSGSATNQEVIGLLSKALPSLTQGALFYTGSAWILGPLPTTDIAPGYDDYILGTSHTGVTAWFAPGGDVTFVSNSFEVTGLLTHALPSLTTGYLRWSGSAWVFGAGGGTTVTGTGLWFNTSGALNSASVALAGDLSPGAVSGTSFPVTVAYLQGNLLTAPSPSAGQVLMWTPGDTPAWKPQTAGSSSGDITGEYTDLTVNSLQGYTVTMPGSITTGYVLTYNGSAWVPEVGGGGGTVTWAYDLAGSSSTEQFVSSIGSHLGGLVTLGDGVHLLQLAGAQFSGSSSVGIEIAGGQNIGTGIGGFVDMFGGHGGGGASAAGQGGTITVQGGTGATATSGTATGGAGATATLIGGGGGGGFGSNQNGGPGGDAIITAGEGGSGTGSGFQGESGGIFFNGGAAATIITLGRTGVGLGLAPGAVTLTTGTTTLTAAQATFAYIDFGSSTLSGACTVIFPTGGGTGQTWWIDATDVTFAGHAITLEIDGVAMSTTITSAAMWQVVYTHAGKFFAVAMPTT